MKIVHVVTFLSEDGAYGGPVTVALNQARELARRGHDVTLLAAAPISSPITRVEDSVKVRLFPKHQIPRLGFAGMMSPGLWSSDEIERGDVIHVHMARDLVSLPAAIVALRRGVSVVIQTHGMVDASNRVAARLLDPILTRKALQGAGAVLTLTEREDLQIRAIAPRARTTRIVNGIALSIPDDTIQGEREVLFLARLHPRKRPLEFVEMARLLSGDMHDVRFTIAGPDEGMADAVQSRIKELGLSRTVTWIGPVRPAETRALMRRAAVYVLPSVDEVFPMTILEAFEVKTPVVATKSLGIAAECEEYGAALLTDGSAEALANAVRDALRGDTAKALTDGAMKYLRENLDVRRVVDRLERIYLSVTSASSEETAHA